MKGNLKVSCIIPYYNEGLRPVEVVKSLLKVHGISQIITIDDASFDDRAYQEIKARFPQVLAIRLNKNQGKAVAVREGLKHAGSDYIFLVDGDLLNIKPYEFENTVKLIIKNPKIDMIILRRMVDPSVVVSRWIRHDIIFSGQRILKKVDLLKVFSNTIYGYQLEIAINTYMMQNKKNVYWLPSSVQNLHKFHKWPFWEGWKIGIKAFKDFITYRGWKNFVIQTLFFCREGIRQDI